MEKELFKTMACENFDANWRALHKGQVSLFTMTPFRSEDGVIRKQDICLARKTLLLLSCPTGTLTAGMFERKLVAVGTGIFESFKEDSISVFVSRRKKQVAVMIVNQTKKLYTFLDGKKGVPKDMYAVVFCSTGKHALLCTAIQSDVPEIDPICISEIDEKSVSRHFLQLSAAFLKANLAGATTDAAQIDALKRLAGGEVSDHDQ